MLIYAFRTPDGTWYGDPDAAIHDAEPRRGTLTLAPTTPGEQGGLFDGQWLEVLYAACGLEESQNSYRLDGGGTFPATWRVCELRSTAYHPRRPAPAWRRAAPCVSLDVSGPHRWYYLTAEPGTHGRARPWTSPQRPEDAPAFT